MERESEVKRVNFNLEKIPPEERVDLFTKFLQTHPDSWRFEKVLELGIKQSGESGDLIEEESETVEDEEEIEEEIDENLRGITNAVLKGTGLRENQFVQDCLESGFYFSSVRGLFDDLDSTDSMELELKFKESPKKTFDVSIVDEYERTDEAGYEDGNLGSKKRAEIRDLFRRVVVDLYGDYIDEPALIEDKYGTDSLTDLKNIGDQIAERLVDKGFDSPEKVFNADTEELKKIEGIGEETAQDLAGSDD
jgi:hypothetical protein